MTKSPRLVHESWRLMPGAPACDVYKPAKKDLRERTEPEGFFVIAPGLGSVKSDYSALARNLAARGFTVLSPNCNAPMPGADAGGALERRADTIARTVDAWEGERVRFLPHSLGAPVVMKSFERMGSFGTVKEVGSVSFLQPAGFDNHGWLDIIRYARFFTNEAIPSTVRLSPSNLISPKVLFERLDLGQRMAEIRDLWGMPEGYMTEGVTNLVSGGVQANFFVGPRDNLTRPGPIRRSVEPIVGPDNIIDIHPEAGHLTAQTHSRHLANLLLANLVSVQDRETPLLQAA